MLVRLPGNIPLFIQPSFWLLAFFIGWMSGGGVARFLWLIAIVFGSVLVHELGHALMAMFWGQRVKIELNLFGGVTIRQNEATSRGKEFLIVLMGPLFGFLLCGFAFFALEFGAAQGMFFFFLQDLYAANLVWNIANLLPVHPLDGAKLLTIVLEAVFGFRGVRVSYLLSTLFAIACCLLFVVLGSVIAGIFFLCCAFESYKSWQNAHHFHSEHKDENLLEELSRAQFDWEHSQPEKAISRLESVVSKHDKGATFYKALEQLTSYLLFSSQTQKAYVLLAPRKKLLSIGLLKQFQLACYKLGYWQEALDAGKKAFLEEHDMTCAILNAFCSAQLLQVDPAISWLRCIQNAKGVDMRSLVASEDFEAIQNEPSFQKFVATM